MSYVDERLSDSLIWWPERGMGYRHPVTPIDYGESYFEHYAKLEETERGRQITTARIEMVGRYTPGTVVDVGIGSGHFIKTRPDKTLGYDVCPKAIEWLKSNGLWCDPYGERVSAVTMWDVMEHLEDPGALLRNVRHFVFLSLPIFADGDAVLKSKHYKPGEHLWYFTGDGLIWFMAEHGFAMREWSNAESLLGREGIGSFAFAREG